MARAALHQTERTMDSNLLRPLDAKRTKNRHNLSLTGHIVKAEVGSPELTRGIRRRL